MKFFTQDEVNLHTHCKYCRHAVGEVQDYVDEAEKDGIKVLGMSDHCPVPDDRWHSVRMFYSELDAYRKDCEDAAERVPQGMHFFRGFETDYHIDYVSYYRDELLGERGFDYLLLAVHNYYAGDGSDIMIPDCPVNDKVVLHTYTKTLIEGMQSGLFLYAVHPDIFASFYLEWDEEAKACSRDILACAASLHFPIEINGQGIRAKKVVSSRGERYRYPLQEFWNLAAEYDVAVVTAADCHKPEDMLSSRKACKEIAAKANLSFARYAIDENGNIVIQ